jgi:hypothetical protein
MVEKGVNTDRASGINRARGLAPEQRDAERPEYRVRRD